MTLHEDTSMLEKTVESQQKLLIRYLLAHRRGHPLELDPLAISLSSDKCNFVNR